MTLAARGEGALCSRGFTLIETVVALAILALSLAALYEAYGWSLRRTASIERRELAWMTAQSLLSGIREPLHVGIDRGETNEGLRWASHVEPYEEADDAPAARAAFAVTVEVRWGERPSQSVLLRSVRLGDIAP